MMRKAKLITAYMVDDDKLLYDLVEQAQVAFIRQYRINIASVMNSEHVADFDDPLVLLRFVHPQQLDYRLALAFQHAYKLEVVIIPLASLLEVQSVWTGTSRSKFIVLGDGIYA